MKAGRKKAMSETYELIDPVVLDDGEVLTSVTFRKMTAGDMIKIEEAGESQARLGWALASSVTGLPVQVIEKISFDDLVTINEKGEAWLGKFGTAMHQKVDELMALENRQSET
jgi:hypothetical protein